MAVNRRKDDADIFDYVIVGGGSAGSVLAQRLTADGKVSVCVLEAGPWDTHPLIHIPAGFVKLHQNPKVTWQFATEPTSNTADRALRLPQGRVIGGSSSVNGMVYNRGQSDDFDHWAQLGNRGWSYADVLPYFRRSENRLGVGEPAYRGFEGMLPVTDNDWQNDLCDRFVDGVVGLGLPRNPDHNGASQEGVCYFQRAIKGGRRISAARAFLHPAKSRRNLEVRTGSQVVGVLVEDRVAKGVEYLQNSAEGARRIFARREVILSAGTANTAKILQLSGIGSGEFLGGLGIPTVHHLPGVGLNLRDHYAVRMVYQAKNVTTINEYARGIRLIGQIARWVFRRPSILTITPTIICVFGRSEPALSSPDLMFAFTPGSYKNGTILALDDYPGLTCGPTKLRPDSTGYVRIRSSDPREAPIIQPNYLEAVSDQTTTIAGLRLARRFLVTPEVSPLIKKETLPGAAAQTDDELLQFAREYGMTSFHLVGSAKMGPASDPMAVVDEKLRVHGIQGLRVVDASVMPTMVSANTYAATLMIAEKAADMILDRSIVSQRAAA